MTVKIFLKKPNKSMSDKKKALVIFGSPHKGSFTYLMCKSLMEVIEEKYEVSQIDAFESNFKNCIDCKMCRTKQGCRFPDMDIFDSIFRVSDLIVIASPVYNLAFPAPLKTIIDRLQRYYNEQNYLNIKLKKKSAVLLLTCGRQNSEKWINILAQQTQIVLKAINVSLIHTIYLKNTDSLNLGIDNLSRNVKIDINNIIKKYNLTSK